MRQKPRNEKNGGKPPFEKEKTKLNDEVVAKVQEQKATIKVDWKKVIRRFDEIYNERFHLKAKVSFEEIPEISSHDIRCFDAGGLRFCRVLLLDAFLTILLRGRLYTAPSGNKSKKSFYQANVLRECILQQVKESNPQLFEQLITSSRKQQGNTASSSSSSSPPSSVNQHILVNVDEDLSPYSVTSTESVSPTMNEKELIRLPHVSQHHYKHSMSSGWKEKEIEEAVRITWSLLNDEENDEENDENDRLIRSSLSSLSSRFHIEIENIPEGWTSINQVKFAALTETNVSQLTSKRGERFMSLINHPTTVVLMKEVTTAERWGKLLAKIVNKAIFGYNHGSEKEALKTCIAIESGGDDKSGKDVVNQGKEAFNQQYQTSSSAISSLSVRTSPTTVQPPPASSPVIQTAQTLLGKRSHTEEQMIVEEEDNEESLYFVDDYQIEPRKRRKRRKYTPIINKAHDKADKQAPVTLQPQEQLLLMPKDQEPRTIARSPSPPPPPPPPSPPTVVIATDLPHSPIISLTSSSSRSSSSIIPTSSLNQAINLSQEKSHPPTIQQRKRKIDDQQNEKRTKNKGKELTLYFEDDEGDKGHGKDVKDVKERVKVQKQPRSRDITEDQSKQKGKKSSADVPIAVNIRHVADGADESDLSSLVSLESSWVSHSIALPSPPPLSPVRKKPIEVMVATTANKDSPPSLLCLNDLNNDDELVQDFFISSHTTFVKDDFSRRQESSLYFDYLCYSHEYDELEEEEEEQDEEGALQSNTDDIDTEDESTFPTRRIRPIPPEYQQETIPPHLIMKPAYLPLLRQPMPTTMLSAEVASQVFLQCLQDPVTENFLYWNLILPFINPLQPMKAIDVANAVLEASQDPETLLSFNGYEHYHASEAEIYGATYDQQSQLLLQFQSPQQMLTYSRPLTPNPRSVSAVGSAIGSPSLGMESQNNLQTLQLLQSLHQKTVELASQIPKSTNKAKDDDQIQPDPQYLALLQQQLALNEILQQLLIKG